MNHQQKVKLARSMMTPAEIREGVSIWNSYGWTKRADARRKKGMMRVVEVKEHVIALPQQQEWTKGTVQKWEKETLWQRFINGIKKLWHYLITQRK